MSDKPKDKPFIIDGYFVTARTPSIMNALQELANRFGTNALNFVETGTIRNRHDPGDGWATLYWKSWVEKAGGRVWTVDISRENIRSCRRVTGHSDHIDYVVSDSVAFLENFPKVIHFLYLDSFDSSENTGEPSAACEHQLKEAQAVIDKLHPGALILLDDVGEDLMGGKAELSIPFFQSEGFEIMKHEAGQVLLGRKPQ